MSISFSKWQLTALNLDPPQVIPNRVRAHLRLGNRGTAIQVSANQSPSFQNVLKY